SQVTNVVIHCQGGDGSTVVPLEVVLPPSLTITLPGEEGVVGDDGSVDGSDATCGYLRGEVVEGMQRRIGAGGVRVIRIGAPRECWISTSDEAQRTAQMPVGCDWTFCDDVGLHSEVGAEQGEGCGGGEELGVRGGLEVLLIVECIDRLAVECDHGDA